MTWAERQSPTSVQVVAVPVRMVGHRMGQDAEMTRQTPPKPYAACSRLVPSEQTTTGLTKPVEEARTDAEARGPWRQ